MTATIDAPIAYRMSILSKSVRQGMTMIPPPSPRSDPSTPATIEMQSVMNVNDSGKLVNWKMELASPNGLMRQGWKVDSLKPGDRVAVSGYAARDGSHLMNARKVILGGKSFSTVKDDTVPLK